MEPYVLPAGEGRRTYRWHGVRVEVKAGSIELDGAVGISETLTRKGEEPHEHVHELEDELFYILDGSLTLHCAGKDYDVEERAFAFVPKGTPHTYTIRSDGDVRFLVFSVPGSFTEGIEQTGERID
jgi:mannose-6-phosphate isomerase-like protein (cupin superfamily)